MDKFCVKCGKELQSTGGGPGWMNAEQWDASKAGDYFAPCEDATNPNGNCYFKKFQRVDAFPPLISVSDQTEADNAKT